MCNINESAIASSALILLLSGASLAAEAVEIHSSYENGNILLSVPGLYYQAQFERAPAPEGPYEDLGTRWFGCTEACEFLDAVVVEGTTYWYRMTVIPQYGPLMHLGPVAVTTPPLPRRIFDSSASPNPFSSVVSVRFRIPTLLAGQGDVPVRVSILDAAGRTVRGLSSEAMSRGDRTVDWDGLDVAGRRLPSGLYFYAIEAGARREAGRLIKLN